MCDICVSSDVKAWGKYFPNQCLLAAEYTTISKVNLKKDNNLSSVVDYLFQAHFKSIFILW